MTTTTNLNITHWAESQDQPYVTLNEGINILDGLADALVHNMASDANYTLDTATGDPPYEWQHLVIQITDTTSPETLSTTRNIVCPDYLRVYIFVNSTAKSLVFKNSGTGITVAAGKTAILRSDGANVVRLSADF